MNPDSIPVPHFDPRKDNGIVVACKCAQLSVNINRRLVCLAERSRGQAVVHRPASGRAAIAELLTRGWTYQPFRGWLCPECSTRTGPDTPIMVVDPRGEGAGS